MTKEQRDAESSEKTAALAALSYIVGSYSSEKEIEIKQLMIEIDTLKQIDENIDSKQLTRSKITDKNEKALGRDESGDVTEKSLLRKKYRDERRKLKHASTMPLPLSAKGLDEDTEVIRVKERYQPQRNAREMEPDIDDKVINAEVKSNLLKSANYEFADIRKHIRIEH